MVQNESVFQQQKVDFDLLHLLLKNTGSSVLTTSLLVLTLVLTLQTPQNRTFIIAWAVAILTSKYASAAYSKRLLQHSELQNLPRYQHQLMLINAVDGFIWGGLAWLTLGNVHAVGKLMVIVVLAAVGSASMSSLAPVLPVFWAFIWVEFSMFASAILFVGDTQFYPIAIAGFLYIATLGSQAKNHYQAAKLAVALQHENLDLVAKLKIESENAYRAYEEAKVANMTKSRFLTSTSHDLRQPIHAMGMFLDTLSMTPLNDEQIELVNKANSARQTSIGMLNTYLDFSKIETGSVQVNLEHFEMQPLLRNIENDLAYQADAKGLYYRCREADFAVYSDPHLLERIIRNFIANAIQYTQHGGVLIGCRKYQQWISIEVWDSGIGIAPESIPEIFNEFVQLDNPERDRHKGFGLGLAIAKQLANTLGHEISVASQLGKGSVFKLRVQTALSGMIQSEEAYLHHETIRLNGLNVLILDDDLIVLEAVSGLLRYWGCTCFAAENIEKAKQYGDSAIDILICDYRLKGLHNGVQAIAAMRQRCAKHLPAIMITGETSNEVLDLARQSHISVLHKPLSGQVLKRKMQEAMQSHS